MEKAEEEMETINNNVMYHVLKEKQETDHNMPPPSSTSLPQLSRNEDDSSEYVT